ncbi:Glucose 1-dehydrogenase [Massilia sp. Bi118]|uniref:SDR family NAD(P)-dependent oxidoreductase n=1 Tax=Massilia sp. Bi118 TaxID=2822346 RepID=UPI001E0A2252|nr:SDR family oxidoreductase [Massilia sp. Bi118]CAH0136403.1 Glucose 1-dehydrogenase [Massilia sp. Bi118]
MTEAAFNPFSLEGRQILVTGASSGIGEATARLCANMGARVFACGRNEERLNKVVSELAGAGHQAIVGDLTDPAARQLVVDAVPSLDGCVFSAGTAALAPMRLLSQKHLDAMFAVNYNAPVLLTQALLAKRRIAHGASMVYVTSIAQHVTPNATAAYAGAKAALTASVRIMALEGAKHGIRANCVSPGYVATPMLDGLEDVMNPEQLAATAPLGMIEPDEIAAGIAWLLAPASRWVSRTTLLIDSGQTLHVR